MFLDVIYTQEKVFSRQLKRSDRVEPVLDRIKQKEGLSTAILFLEGEGNLFLVFILEDKLFASYRLINNAFTALPFSDCFQKAAQIKGTLDLYLVSPVLFKALLMLAQKEPSVVVTSDIIDPEQLLTHIEQKRKEAVLVLKIREQANLFYFIDGSLRDAYLEETSHPVKMSDLQEKLLELVFSQKDPVRLELFDESDIQAAPDSETYEKQPFSVSHEAPKKTAGDRKFSKGKRGGKAKVSDKATEDGSSEKKALHKRVKEGDQEEEPSKDRTEQGGEADLWVEVLNGNRAGFLIRVASEPVSLGRGNVSVRLDDPEISRFHAELEWAESGLIIRDHKSTNGLFVNGKKIAQKILALNDAIQIGDVRLKVICGS